MKVRYQGNTVTEDDQRTCSHSLPAGIIRLQARTTHPTCKAAFTKMLRHFRQEEIDGGVFGDIAFNKHRKWIERVYQAADYAYADADITGQLTELKEIKGVTPYGEAEEYHTLVTDDPFFQKRLEILKTKNALREEHWFLEILKADLEGR
jgi:diphthamide synthase (EF-2-diphthine--ammonia ligase)